MVGWPSPFKEADMNNAEYLKLMKAQREKAKLKEAEVIEALKIEETPAPDPEPETLAAEPEAEPEKPAEPADEEVDEYVITD